MEEENELASSLYSRRKKPSMSLACCFKAHHHHHHHHQRHSSFDVSSSSSPAFLPSPKKSPSAWIRSKASDFPEIKGKYKNFMSKMSRHRRHSSADLSYDPLSYALNFEEHDDMITSDVEDPYRSFTSRLPLSPPSSKINHGSSSVPSSSSVTGIRKSLSEMTVSSPRRNVNGFDIVQTNERRIPEVIEVGNKVMKRNRSIEKSTTPRAVAVAEVKRSLENVTPCVVAQMALDS